MVGIGTRVSGYCLRFGRRLASLIRVDICKEQVVIERIWDIMEVRKSVKLLKLMSHDASVFFYCSRGHPRIFRMEAVTGRFLGCRSVDLSRACMARQRLVRHILFHDSWLVVPREDVSPLITLGILAAEVEVGAR